MSTAATGRVLVDTCGWVDFLRSRAGALGDLVERALADDLACLCSVSVAELLQGVKGIKEKRQLDMLIDSVRLLNVEPGDWVSAGLALQNTRSKGFQIPLTDALVAAVAIRHGLPVMTIDKHFAQLGVAVVGV
jgi:predicted nucleic acid-binding protein